MDISNDYIRDFDSETFLDVYYGSVDRDGEEGLAIRFLLDSQHTIFNSDYDFGRRMLDVGSGPTIQCALSASRRVHQVDLSDFTPRNLDVLRNWKSGKRNELTSLVKYEMNLFGDRRSTSERENELRSMVQGIYRKGATKEDVFLEAASPNPDYDVITSCFCLEAISNSKDIYKKSVKNVVRLLKPGGYLILFGGIGESYYKVGDFNFPYTSLQGDEIKEILVENGFQILKWQTLFPERDDFKSMESPISDYKNVFAMLAKKGT